MAFKHNAFSTKVCLAPAEAYIEFKDICVRFKGNLKFVSMHYSVDRKTVGRWLATFAKAGLADPRGAYAPGGLPVPQRRRQKSQKKRGLGL